MDEHTAPHFATSALVTIDVQRDVLDGGPLEIPGTSAALPAMQLLVDAFREEGRPIVHMVRLYPPNGSDADRCRRAALAGGARILLAGSDGAELAAQLVPPAPASPESTRLDPELLLSGRAQRLTASEHVLYKPRWGAFYRTPLEAHLRDLGVDTLVFVGANFPNCPRSSIVEASERDFRVVCVCDAVSGLYDQAVVELDGIGVAVLRAFAVREALIAATRVPEGRDVSDDSKFAP
jgi:nicotinamidase-related amidase